MAFDLLVRGGTCVLPSGLARVDLGVSGGKIAGFGDLTGEVAERELDARNLHILPGAIDTGVHLRELDGSAQVLGGVTSVLDARAHPSSAAAFEDKLSRARGRAHCDYAFFLTAAPDLVDDLDRLERLPGCAGVVVSLTADDDPLHRALARGTRRVTASLEPDTEPMEAGAAVDLFQSDDVPRALQRFLNMAKRAGRRVHVQHVQGEGALALLFAHRDLATVACLIDHLDDPAATDLWTAVRGGLVDAVHSDPTATSASVHLTLAHLLEHVHAGRLSLQHVAELLSSGPARVYSLARKGRLALGYDADLVLVDLAAEHTHSGVRLHGWPVATVLRGDIVAREGRPHGPPTGAPVRFSDTLRMVVL
jgi:dihydroorotase